MFKSKFKDQKDVAIPDVANGIHKVVVNSRTINSPPPTVEEVTLNIGG
jgi:hypothetical protein